MNERELDFQKTMHHMETCMPQNISKNQLGNRYTYTKGNRKIQVVYVDKAFDKRSLLKILRNKNKEYVIYVEKNNRRLYISIQELIYKGLGIK